MRPARCMIAVLAACVATLAITALGSCTSYTVKEDGSVRFTRIKFEM